jgi:preprotein translocase subunit SecG
MREVLLVAQALAGVALIILVLLQAKGTGLSAVFGGEGGMYRSRRGVEKLLHRGTILLSVVFIGLAVGNLLLR